MSIIVLLVVVAAIGAVAVVLAGRGGGQAEFEPDRPAFELPDRPLRRADIDAARFSVGMRGYRMDQVDVLVDRLALELEQRDALIDSLRGEPDGDSAAEPVTDPVGASLQPAASAQSDAAPASDDPPAATRTVDSE